jgi:gas vesicle protein
MTKVKSIEKNACSNNINNILMSATAGSVIGAIAALLLAPKSGKRLRNDIYETYEDITEKGQDIYEDAVDTGQKVADMATEYASTIKDNAAHLLGSVNLDDSPNTNLIIGALAGGILGATAIFMLLPSAEKNPRDELSPKIKGAGKYLKNKLNWFETAKDIFETISTKAHHATEGASENIKESCEKSPLHDVMELASAGLQLWQNIKNRR